MCSTYVCIYMYIVVISKYYMYIVVYSTHACGMTEESYTNLWKHIFISLSSYNEYFPSPEVVHVT